jgi:hypothetical protein
MIKVDCSELSGETKLAIAVVISNALNGTGVALLDGNNIVIDTLSGPEIGADRVEPTLRSYISGREDASAYNVESDGQHIVVRSSVPVSARAKRVEDRLPPGLLQCPACGFVTMSKDRYNDHLRIHDLIRGF